MEKKKIREKIILELLINKYKNEKVDADLVKAIEIEFHQINEELKEKKKGKSANEIAGMLH
jgi:hypothetical protein